VVFGAKSKNLWGQGAKNSPEEKGTKRALNARATDIAGSHGRREEDLIGGKKKRTNLPMDESPQTLLLVMKFQNESTVQTKNPQQESRGRKPATAMTLEWEVLTGTENSRHNLPKTNGPP